MTFHITLEIYAKLSTCKKWLGRGERGKEMQKRLKWMDGRIKKGKLSRVGERCIKDPYRSSKFCPVGSETYFDGQKLTAQHNLKLLYSQHHMTRRRKSHVVVKVTYLH